MITGWALRRGGPGHRVDVEGTRGHGVGLRGGHGHGVDIEGGRVATEPDTAAFSGLSLSGPRRGCRRQGSLTGTRAVLRLQPVGARVP